MTISIHAPREGSDRTSPHEPRISDQISIHAPREGSDPPQPTPVSHWTNFYPRSPRGERLPSQRKEATKIHISIHAPREGSDQKAFIQEYLVDLFLSTLPARGATAWCAGRRGSGGDFYPRSPRGERRKADECRARLEAFLSTLPARGATVEAAVKAFGYPISIHAPREGSDC